MPTEPKTIRETHFVVEGLEARVVLIQTIVWWVLGLLGTLIAGAIALYVQLGDVKTDLGSVKATITAINGQITELGKDIRELRNEQSSATMTLGRIDTAIAALPKGPPNSANIQRIVSSPSNVQLVRAMLKPVPTGQKIYAFGERVSGVNVPLLPSEVIDKFPELTGLGYIFDAKASIVFVDGNYRVVAVIAS
jgi:hypothetical protein